MLSAEACGAKMPSTSPFRTRASAARASSCDRSAHAAEDDRNARGRSARGLRRARFLDEQDVDPVADELDSRRGQRRLVALREADTEHEILVLAIAERFQAVAQTGGAGGEAP